MSYDPTLGRFLEQDPIHRFDVEVQSGADVTTNAIHTAQADALILLGDSCIVGRTILTIVGATQRYEFVSGNPGSKLDPSGLYEFMDHQEVLLWDLYWRVRTHPSKPDLHGAANVLRHIAARRGQDPYLMGIPGPGVVAAALAQYSAATGAAGVGMTGVTGAWAGTGASGAGVAGGAVVAGAAGVGAALGAGIHYSGLGGWIYTDWLGTKLADWWIGPLPPTLPEYPTTRPVTQPLPGEGNPIEEI